MKRGALHIAAVSAVFTASFARLLQMIDRHAVDVPFFDQWDFLAGLREGASQWQLFAWQHGPHRMGLGYFFIEAVYAASGWSQRTEAFATAALFAVIVAVSLVVKVKAVGPLTWLDALLPALLLSPTQFELFIAAPNAGHGPIPLLLVLVAPLCWLIRSPALRAVATGALAFAAAFTGFAIFLVPCLAALFALEAASPGRGAQARAWDAASALLCASSLLTFAHGYHFAAAVECGRRPGALEYPAFAGLPLLRPLGLGHLVPGAALLGDAACLVAVVFGAVALRGALRRDRTFRPRVSFVFCAFSLCFVASAAAGRACIGLDQAFASRYVPYVLPIWIAAYLELTARAAVRPRLRIPLGAAVLLVVILQVSLSNDTDSMRWFSEGKARWRACYLATGDEARCNATFQIYPRDGTPNVLRMLEYLRARRLSLFR